MGRHDLNRSSGRLAVGRTLIVALGLAGPLLALARPDAGAAPSRSAQVQEMRLQMREYRKSWVSPRPAAATEGMPASVLPSRPARTRLTDGERDLLRRELRELRIKPAP